MLSEEENWMNHQQCSPDFPQVRSYMRIHHQLTLRECETKTRAGLLGANLLAIMFVFNILKPSAKDSRIVIVKGFSFT